MSDPKNPLDVLPTAPTPAFTIKTHNGYGGRIEYSLHLAGRSLASAVATVETENPPGQRERSVNWSALGDVPFELAESFAEGLLALVRAARGVVAGCKIEEPIREVQKTGVERIAEERERQITQGWTSAHDDSHDDGDLARAAACYAAPEPVFVRSVLPPQRVLFTDLWPWSEQWDKRVQDPTVQQRIRMLEKAGALVAAEIDRLLRRSGQGGSHAPE